MSSSATIATPSKPSLWALVVALTGVLLLLFSSSLSPSQALFSNDGPLAGQEASPFSMPGAFFGIWHNLYWLGSEGGSFTPNITGLMLLLLGPHGYTNFHPVVSLSVLCFSSWFFFRRLGFSATACILGALAATLNMNFVSNVGWGLSSRALSLGMAFLALAAVESSFSRYAVIKTILAGLAVGMSISEGGDNGAIFSLFVAAYAFVRTWIHEPKVGPSLVKGTARVVVMAACATVLAAQTLNVFVGTAVKGMVGMAQEQRTKDQQWDWATQWSLPKAESLRVIIPGLYGYRMDTPDGGQYWGQVGRYPQWRPEYKGNGARSSGAGEYAGVLVVLLAAWALTQSLRKTKSPFTDLERKLIWFWAVAAFIALLFAWGRHAPFYKLVYALPYFSTIRNPMKFMHPFHLALMVLFAYGVQGMVRRYFETTVTGPNSLGARLKSFWKKGQPDEKRWLAGCIVVFSFAVLAFLIQSTSGAGMIRHLTGVGFEESQAKQIAAFSAGEVGMFVLFLALAIGALLLVQSGFFSGPRAKWGAVLLGLILVVDLVRADTPWIRYYNYKERYTSNPVIDVLKTSAHEGRVTVFPLFQNAPRPLHILDNVYKAEWLQHHFLYYDIQSLDVAQEPRMPEDKAAFLNAVGRDQYKYWRLTNARYVMALAGGFVEALNQQLAPKDRPFVERIAFDFTQDEGGFIGIVTNTTGPYALIELTNALPRAKLYSQWQVSTNDQETLTTLARPDFDPAQTVLVGTPLSAPSSGTNISGTVSTLEYSPRKIVLRVEAPTNSVLLYNDRFNPAWTARVDDQKAELFRANFIMRGMQVPAGTHTITMRYEPVITTFYVTLGAVIVGLLLCGFLALVHRREGKQSPARHSSPKASRPA